MNIFSLPHHRYLSAERARGRWQSAAGRVNPHLHHSLTNGVLSSEEEDFLASSMASTKTVCSDAFDFLFDSQNLNPQKIVNHEEILRYTEEKFHSDDPSGGENGKQIAKADGANNTVKHSQCCVIS